MELTFGLEFLTFLLVCLDFVNASDGRSLRTQMVADTTTTTSTVSSYQNDTVENIADLITTPDESIESNLIPDSIGIKINMSTSISPKKLNTTVNFSNISSSEIGEEDSNSLAQRDKRGYSGVNKYGQQAGLQALNEIDRNQQIAYWSAQQAVANAVGRDYKNELETTAQFTSAFTFPVTKEQTSEVFKAVRQQQHAGKISAALAAANLIRQEQGVRYGHAGFLPSTAHTPHSFQQTSRDYLPDHLPPSSSYSPSFGNRHITNPRLKRPPYSEQADAEELRPRPPYSNSRYHHEDNYKPRPQHTRQPLYKRPILQRPFDRPFHPPAREYSHQIPSLPKLNAPRPIPRPPPHPAHPPIRKPHEFHDDTPIHHGNNEYKERPVGFVHRHPNNNQLHEFHNKRRPYPNSSPQHLIPQSGHNNNYNFDEDDNDAPINDSPRLPARQNIPKLPPGIGFDHPPIPRPGIDFPARPPPQFQEHSPKRPHNINNHPSLSSNRPRPPLPPVNNDLRHGPPYNRNHNEPIFRARPPQVAHRQNEHHPPRPDAEHHPENVRGGSVGGRLPFLPVIQFRGVITHANANINPESEQYNGHQFEAPFRPSPTDFLLQSQDKFKNPEDGSYVNHDFEENPIGNDNYDYQETPSRPSKNTDYDDYEQEVNSYKQSNPDSDDEPLENNKPSENESNNHDPEKEEYNLHGLPEHSNDNDNDNDDEGHGRHRITESDFERRNHNNTDKTKAGHAENDTPSKPIKYKRPF